MMQALQNRMFPQQWYGYYSQCTDRLGLCQSNLAALIQKTGSVTQALANGETAQFTMTLDLGTQFNVN